MKKILYTLLMMSSLLVASCTKEVSVSKHHGINAEVDDIETTREMTTLYCNINNAEEAIDLEQLKSYLTTVAADVTTLVAPASVGGTSFAEWLNAEFVGEAVVLTKTNSNSVSDKIVVAAVVNKEFEGEITEHALDQVLILKNPALHFSVKDVNFVVTELTGSINAIPSDWDSTDALTFDPDYSATRKSEAEYLVSKTIDAEEFLYVKNWMWCVNVNAPSSVDLKYGKTFLVEECYDFEENYVSKEEFLTKYTSWSESLVATDAYFAANDVLVYASLVDCLAAQHSVYCPSSVDGERTNFLYASAKLWNLLEPVKVDTASELGVKHYPIMVSLKVEE